MQHDCQNIREFPSKGAAQERSQIQHILSERSQQLTEYYQDGKRHYDPKIGPAYQVWYENNQLMHREFYQQGRYQRSVTWPNA